MLAVTGLLFIELLAHWGNGIQVVEMEILKLLKSYSGGLTGVLASLERHCSQFPLVSFGNLLLITVSLICNTKSFMP